MRVQLTLAHVADAFGVEPSAVRGWVRDGDLPCTDDRGHLTFDRAEVVAWAAQRGLLAKAGALAVQHPGGGSAPVLSGLLRTGGIWRDVPPDRAIETLEAAAARLPGATVAVRQLLTHRLRAADGISWAPVGRGVALPHLRQRVTLGREAGLCALLLLRGPLTLAVMPPDELPITRLVFFIAPSPRAHLDLVGRLTRALLRDDLRQLLMDGAPDATIFTALAEHDAAIEAGASIAQRPERAKP